MSESVNDLRKFYIETLTNYGYYDKDLKAMETDKLSEFYYMELKNNVKNYIRAKKS
jgi:hypothetical protein